MSEASVVLRPERLKLHRAFGTAGCGDSQLTYQAPTSDGTLLGLHQAVGEALSQAGYLPFDPKPLWVEAATFSAVSMHIVAASTSGVLSHRHLVVESPAPWDSQTEQDFLREFFWLPLHEGEAGSPPCFSFAGASPPASVRYLLSNGWWGELEAALIGDLAQSPQLSADAVRAAMQGRLAELSLDSGNAAESYDAILMGLPRISESGYQPAATLTALGLLLGDALAERVGGLQWRLAEPSEGRVLVLADTKCQGFLRPVDFTVEAFAAPPKQVAARYLSWAEERVRSCRPPAEIAAPPSPAPRRESRRPRRARP